MKLMTSNHEQMKKTSAIVLAIFVVVAISALAIISASEDASAVVVKHKSHGHVRCAGHIR